METTSPTPIAHNLAHLKSIKAEVTGPRDEAMGVMWRETPES